MRNLSTYVWGIAIFALVVPANTLAFVWWDVSILPEEGVIGVLLHTGVFMVWGTMVMGLLSISLVTENVNPQEAGPDLAARIQFTQEKVREIAYKASLKHTPRLVVIESEVINATAGSNLFGRSVIAVSTATLQLPDDELSAVLAHETAHIVRGDSLVLATIHSVVYRLIISMFENAGATISWIARTTIWVTVCIAVVVVAGAGVINANPEQMVRPLTMVFVAAIISMALIPIGKLAFKTQAVLIERAIYRHFEVKADKLAAKWTSPEAVTRLLKRLEKADKKRYPGIPHNVFSTHPSHEERIQQIARRANAKSNKIQDTR